MNVGQAIAPAVAQVPERTALVVGDRRCSYRDLDRWVRRVAAALTARGVGPGARVALVDTGSVLSVATILAAARIGAASAQMNVLLTPDELRGLATAVGARIGVAGEPFRSNLGSAVGDGAVLGEDDVARAAGDTVAGVAVVDGDDALILFTSGTTGRPKPVPIGHGVVAERLGFYGTPIDPGAPPVVDMMSAPIFHIGGTLGLLIGLRSGRTVVMLPRFAAGAWLEAVEQHGRRDLSSLRQISYGAAAAPVALVERAVDALPDVRFVNTFGQTETLGAYAALGAEDHWARHKLGTAGRPFPGVELRIVDAVAESDCLAGTVRQVWEWAPRTSPRTGCAPATSPSSTPMATTRSAA